MVAEHLVFGRDISLINASTTVPGDSTFTENDVSKALWVYMAPILLFIGTVGSGLSLLVLCQKHMRQQTTMFYLAVLAVADVAVLYTGMLRLWLENYMDIYIRLQSGLACKLHTFCVYLCLDVSVWVTVAVSIDRCIYVSLPHKAKMWCTMPRARRVIGLILLAMSVINCHFFWTYDRELTSQGMSVWGNSQYRCFVVNGSPVSKRFIENVWPWIDLCVYCLVPFTIMSVTTFIIVRQLIRSENTMADYRQRSLTSKRGSIHPLVEGHNDGGGHGTSAGRRMSANSGNIISEANNNMADENVRCSTDNVTVDSKERSGKETTDKNKDVYNENNGKKESKSFENNNNNNNNDRNCRKSEYGGQNELVVSHDRLPLIELTEEKSSEISTIEFQEIACVNKHSSTLTNNLVYVKEAFEKLNPDSSPANSEMNQPKFKKHLNALSGQKDVNIIVSESASNIKRENPILLETSVSRESLAIPSENRLEFNTSNNSHVQSDLNGNLYYAKCEKHYSESPNDSTCQKASKHQTQTTNKIINGECKNYTPSRDVHDGTTDPLKKLNLNSANYLCKHRDSSKLRGKSNSPSHSNKTRSVCLENEILSINSIPSDIVLIVNSEDKNVNGDLPSKEITSVVAHNNSNYDVTSFMAKNGKKTPNASIHSGNDNDKHSKSHLHVQTNPNAIPTNQKHRKSVIICNDCANHCYPRHYRGLSREDQSNSVDNNANNSNHRHHPPTADNVPTTHPVPKRSSSTNPETTANIFPTTHRSPKRSSSTNPETTANIFPTTHRSPKRSSSTNPETTANIFPTTHPSPKRSSSTDPETTSKIFTTTTSTAPSSRRHRTISTSSSIKPASSTSSRKLSARGFHVSVTLVTINIVFCLLNAPITVFVIGLTYWTHRANEAQVARLNLGWTVVNLLQYSNSAGHIFLYCLTGPRFRRALAEIVARWTNRIKSYFV